MNFPTVLGIAAICMGIYTLLGSLGVVPFFRNPWNAWMPEVVKRALGVTLASGLVIGGIFFVFLVHGK